MNQPEASAPQWSASAPACRARPPGRGPLLLGLMVACAAFAGCAGAGASDRQTGLPSYRCFPAGRYHQPESIMACLTGEPKPGQVFELDLTRWEYLF